MNDRKQLIERLKESADSANDNGLPEVAADIDDAIAALSPVLPEDVKRVVTDLIEAIETATFSANQIREAADMLKRLSRELSEFQHSSFNPDWSLLEASQESLREHMALCTELEEKLSACYEEIEGAVSRLLANDDEIGATRLADMLEDNIKGEK